MPISLREPGCLRAGRAVQRSGCSRGTSGAAARLPSLKTIAQEYGVSHITAEKAIALLRDEGLVVVVIGRGAYVNKDVTSS